MKLEELEEAVYVLEEIQYAKSQEWHRETDNHKIAKMEKEMDAMDIAMDCIKKQMPIRPIKAVDADDTYYCRRCSHRFMVKTKLPDYCPQCGGRLDWWT